MSIADDYGHGWLAGKARGEQDAVKALDEIADTVLRYRPKAKSKPAVQRKRRRTILQKQQAKEK